MSLPRTTARTRFPRRTFVLRLGALVASLLLADAAVAQTGDSARSIGLEDGVTIEVRSARGPLSEEDTRLALEQALERLRAKQASSHIQHQAPRVPPQGDVDRVAEAPERVADSSAVGVVAAPNSILDMQPRWVLFPGSVLFAPPLANRQEPRFIASWTSLDTAATFNTCDTGIGALMPLLRRNFSEEPRDAMQLDAFAHVLGRWADCDYSVAVDYRIGVPITFAKGPWETKIAYEHTSTHLGDEHLLRTGQVRRPHVRDDVVLGAAYRFLNAVRVYGVFAHSFNLQAYGPFQDPSRYDVGIEWSRPEETGIRGQPFAAYDLEMRGDQNYVANHSLQAGWQWRAVAYGPSLRIFLEHFEGRSAFGQFYLERETWSGVGLALGY